jgi:D-aminoacyl-tRNA deacylase
VIGIVVSRADSASEHIGEQLLSVADWTEHEASSAGEESYYRREGFELRRFEEMHLSLSRPAEAFQAALDLLVFVSRHAGDTGALLTAHFTGNFGPADYGGEADSFARACPGAQKAVVAALADHAPEDYQVGIECTHHGPTAVGPPSMFVELGSGESQWEDPEGARAVAQAVLNLEDVAADNWLSPGNTGDGHSAGGNLASGQSPADGDDNAADGHSSVDGDEESTSGLSIDGDEESTSGQAGAGDTAPTPRQLVGFGGGHYAPRFVRIVRETPWAVGHIGADWALDAMGAPEQNRDVIDRAFAASGTRYAVLEADRPDLAAVIDDLGYRAVSETWVREVGTRPLPLVEALEASLSTVEEGLRFGDRSLDPDLKTAANPGVSGGSGQPFIVVDLPDDLLAAVRGIEATAARRAVVEHTLAFETEHGGSQASGRAAIRSESHRERLLEVLADALEPTYDEVERRPDEIVARKQEFDPEKASVLGVPEGPKFGQLAAGQPVEVDGERITPVAVRSEQVDRFEI